MALLPEDRTATEKDEIPGLRPEQSAVVETLSSKHERRPKRAERTKQPRRRPYESDCSGLSKDCPPMPPLKRQRTNPCNFFERYAFYPAFGRSDSTCLLDKFSAPTPYLFRQESMDMSRRKVSLDNLPRSVAPLLSDDEEDEEPSGKYFEDDFLTDFF